MSVRDRYEGVQTAMKYIGESGCLFLSLLSIAEEYDTKAWPNGIDLFTAYKICLTKGFVSKDLYVSDAPGVLYEFTGKKWEFKKMKKLPDPVPDPMYTIEKWYNPRTKFTHFKRRGYDSIVNSVTVKEGYIMEYYTYTVQ